jgi:putative ABC transport system permease protein
MKFLTGAFYENLMLALDTLRSNKLRSFLTIIGVVIGVITVMLISSIISGINVAVEKQVESFGTRSNFLYKMDIGIRTSAPSREERMRKPLTMDDADAMGRSECIGQLPEHTRNCLTLAFVEGRSHDEIARLTSNPLGSVKSWIRRGLMSLKSCLSAEGQTA